jgi:hypothetical protein
MGLGLGKRTDLPAKSTRGKAETSIKDCELVHGVHEGVSAVTGQSAATRGVAERMKAKMHAQSASERRSHAVLGREALMLEP